jgi:hypothetical protein
VHARGLLPRRLDERLDHVRRRRHVGIAAAEIDERLAVLRGRVLHLREQAHEVLLGETVEPVRALHGAEHRAGRISPPRLGTSRTVQPLRERSVFVEINS